MRSRLSRYFKDNVVAFLALFVALGGTSAYAANTVFSTDIVDGEVKSVDIGNGEILSADVKDQSLTTFDVSTFLGVDVVDGTLTGADVADTSSLGTSDIGEEGLFFNDTLIASDIASGAVGSDEVANNSLDDQDIAQGTFVNFDATIGTVAQGFCATREITGVTATGDHLVLTASQADASSVLSYTAEYSANGSAWVKVCNPTNFDVNDGNTHFNLLVIDAQ